MRKKKEKPITKEKIKEKEKPDGVTYSDNFAAVIVKRTDGPGNKIVVKSPTWYHHSISKFKPGQEVTLVVHSRKPKRTEAQNRYYWGVYLPLIAKEKNESDLERLHELFKGKFLTQGVVEVLGEKVRLKKSTTELGVGEFCQFIMDIEALTEVQAPPTESFGLAPLARQPSEIEYPENDLGEPAI